MGNIHYGRYSRLNPPMTIGGVSYGLAVLFNTEPNSPDSADVVTGQFALAPTGTTTKTITCARAVEIDSFFVSRADGGPREQGFHVLKGGNIARTPEPARIYNVFNSRAFAGDDSYDRAQPGDVLWWDGRGYLITEAEPYSVAPAGGVNYNPAEPLATSAVFDLDWLADLFLDAPDLEQNPNARIAFVESTDAALSDAALYVDNGITTTEMSRTIFTTPPDGAGGGEVADPDWYPPGAAFANGAPSFWLDVHQFTFRISHWSSAWGSNLSAIYFHRDLVQLDESADGEEQKAIEGTGTGYSTGGDELTLWSKVTRGNFDIEIFVFKRGAAFGSGSIEWRGDASGSAQMVAMEWDETGYITAVWKREASAGAVAAVAHTANPLAFSGVNLISLRLKKLDDVFTFYWADDLSGGFQEVAAITLPATEENTPGYFGLGNYDAANPCRFQGIGIDNPGHKIALGDGVVSRRIIKTWDAIQYARVYGISGATALQSVSNILISDAPELSESADYARDHYTKLGNALTFGSESAGDRIRVTEAAPASVPAGRGRAPSPGSVAGTENFALGTVNGIEYEATSNANENHANWLDALTVHDPEQDLAAVAGEAFSITRNPVFDSRNPPSFFYDWKGGAGDWLALSAEHYYLRAVEGILLVTQLFLDALENDTAFDISTGRLCIRAEGYRFNQGGNMPARVVQDLAAALQQLDAFFLRLSVGGDTVGVAGNMLVAPTQLVPSGFACYAGAVEPSGYEFGVQGSVWSALVDDLIAHGASIPYWDQQLPGSPLFYTVAFGGSPMSFTSAAMAVDPEPCGSPSSVTQGDIAVQVYAARVEPFDFNPTGDMGFGQPYSIEGPADALPGTITFNFLGIPIAGDLRLGMLAGLGAVCVEAFAEAVFSGVQSSQWSIYHKTIGLYGAGSIYWEGYYYHNGVKVAHRVIENSIVTYDESNADPGVSSTGSIAYQAIGKRLKTGNIYLPRQERFEPVPGGVYYSYGGGLAVGGSITSGVRTRINVTNVINGMLGAADDQATEFFLWPSRAGVTPQSSASSLASYAYSLLPTLSGSASRDVDGYWTRIWTQANERVTWDSVSLGNIFARFRLADGSVVTNLIPLNRPRVSPMS